MTGAILLRWLLWGAFTAALCLAGLRLLGRSPASGASPFRLALRRLRRNRAAMIALCALITLAMATIAAPLLAPYEPHVQHDLLALRTRPPSLAHPFGTDPYSRDVLTRVLHGGRISLSVGLLAMLLSLTIGTAYGAAAGYAGGRVDTALMRILDALLSIPRILLLIAVIALWGRVPVPVLIAAIGLTGWYGVSRIVRAQVMALREQDFVLSARALGAGGFRLVTRHMLPNVLSPVIVAATLGVGNVIILEAGLSFLGIGVQPPVASWGNIIGEGAHLLTSSWWLSVFPGAAIVGTVLALNVVGDGLRDSLDPRQLPETSFHQ